MRKIAALVLSLIIILANTASLRSFELSPADLLENAIAVEFSVLGFLSASALPLRILNDIVSGDNAFNGRQPPRKQENRKERNTASDSLIGCPSAELRTADGCQGTAVSVAAGVSLPAFFPGTIYPAQETQGPPGFVFLSFLVFLIVLSLSNLPEGVLLFCRMYSRSRYARTGIFLCRGETR